MSEPLALAPRSPWLRLGASALASLVFVAANLGVPWLLHGLPGAGVTFLPLLWFTVVASLIAGPGVGFIVALGSPLASTLLTGMPVPAALPLLLVKSLALALALALAQAWKAPGRGLAIVASVLVVPAVGFVVERGASVPAPVAWDHLVQSWPGLAILAGLAGLGAVGAQARGARS